MSVYIYIEVYITLLELSIEFCELRGGYLLGYAEATRVLF